MSRSENIAWHDAHPFGHHPDFSDDDTLGGTRTWMLERFRAGELSDCPCCGRAVKLYPRSISAVQVKVLVMLARGGGAESQAIMLQSKQGGGDYSKLSYWDFIVQADKRWRCTERGREFLRGKLRVPKYAYIYDGTVQGFSIEDVHITDVVDKVFSIEEIMDPANVREYSSPELAL